MKKIKIAFDIGGVISKYPDIFRTLLRVVDAGSYEFESWFGMCEVHIISDMYPLDKLLTVLRDNGFDFINPSCVHSADFAKHGERCKAVLCEELGIDLLIDDHPGYVTDGKHVRLLVMPN